MEDKTVLVTGGSSGIGLEIARGLAMRGADVLIVGRDEHRTAAAAAGIRRDAPGSEVTALTADLSSRSEVQRLAQTVMYSTFRLDVLVNNAGAIYTDRVTTIDGFERTWALNHLAYVGLALELLPMLEASGEGRIINSTSEIHRRARIDFDDLHGQRRFDGMRAYAQSKLANVLFTNALARRMQGHGVTVNAQHPGFIASGIHRGGTNAHRFAQALLAPFMSPPAEGAETAIHLASSPEVAGITGGYFMNSAEGLPSHSAQNVALQEKLWQETLEQLELDDVAVPALEAEAVRA